MDSAIYYDGDAYSTAQKIMGRQSAGKAFIRGVVRTWPDGPIHGIGPHKAGAVAMLSQLRTEGYANGLVWHPLASCEGLADVGSMYYPSIPTRSLAHLRQSGRSDAFSFIGVTHTLSSKGVLDQLADLALRPFRSWDALICTSRAAYELVSSLHGEVREWWSKEAGMTRFSDVMLPVIPLGVDGPAFAPVPGCRQAARSALGLSDEDVVFLFSGRLSFHAKANPAPMYQALEKVAREVPVVCVEAGLFPNEHIRAAYRSAQLVLAPSVRFVWVDGMDDAAFRHAWQGADVFVSLSDNIQETFGLTPLEAMAAGLPVVVSDWNGYRDTVQDGIEGFRVRTIIPPADSGIPLAMGYMSGRDSYDYYIGRASLAAVVDPEALASVLLLLARDKGKRRSMGQAGLKRAQREFDWPVVLHQYAELARELGFVRSKDGYGAGGVYPVLQGPFSRFAHYATDVLVAVWTVVLRSDAITRFEALMGLSMLNYAFDDALFSREGVASMLETLHKHDAMRVDALCAAVGMDLSAGVRMVMWLWKFDLVVVVR